MGDLRLPTLRYYRDQVGDWRWSLIADNGHPISASTEGYRRIGDCVRSWDITRGALKATVEITREGETIPFNMGRD